MLLRIIIVLGALMFGASKVNLAQGTLKIEQRHNFSADVGFIFFQAGDPDHFYDSWGGGFSYGYNLQNNLAIKAGFSYFQSSDRNIAVFTAEDLRAENLDDTFLKSSSELYVDVTYSLIRSEKSDLGLTAGLGLQFFRETTSDVISSSTIVDSNTGEVLEIRIIDESHMNIETTPGFRFGAQYYYKTGRSFSFGPKINFCSYSGKGRDGENIWTVGLLSRIQF